MIPPSRFVVSLMSPHSWRCSPTRHPPLLTRAPRRTAVLFVDDAQRQRRLSCLKTRSKYSREYCDCWLLLRGSVRSGASVLTSPGFGTNALLGAVKIVISESVINISFGGVVERPQIASRRKGAALALCLCVTLTLTLLIPGAARAQSDDLKKQAQALQVEGVKLLQKGDNRGALAKFNEAFTLVQSPKIMFNMGKAYRGLGNDVEALRAFDTFLDEAPFAPKVSRNDAEREVQALRLKLSYIEVVTDDTGSTVRIDGHDVGKAPLARPVVVLPGSHEVKVEKTGMVTDTRSIAPIAGQKIRVVAKLTPVPEKPVAVTPAKPPRRKVAAEGDPSEASPLSSTDPSHPPKPIDSPPVESRPATALGS